MPFPLSRRQFAGVLAGAPSAYVKDQAPPPAAPGRPVPVVETPPFSEPLEFQRSGIAHKVQAFPLTLVRLLDGPCRLAAEWNRGYMSRLPVERLLHTFHGNAGLPSSAAPLGGWESPKSELRGHFVGHYLSACGLHSASTGDRDIKARGDELVSGLARCQSAAGQGGYLSAFPLEFFERLDQGKGVWAPYYTIHKIMAGLLDMHLHAGNGQALDVLTRMAEWVDRWTAARTDAQMQEILKNEFGGMSGTLYQLAAVTGEDRWGRAGDRFQKREFLRPLALRRDELRGLHANTHIPQVIGAARRYEISGDGRFRDIAAFFWETVWAGRTYSTGGSSNNELWLTGPRRLALEMGAASHHQECCCAYNMMKLSRQLYSWTGNPRYIDSYERNLLNHRLGTIQPETGHSAYFLSLTAGAWKTFCSEDNSFWCCTGSALEEFAKLADTIYHHDGQGIYVNLFIASELDDRERGIRLRQETGFPVEPRTAVIVTAAPPKEFTLRLRMPGWLEGAPAVRINGRKLEGGAAPGGYLSVRRVWKKGDRVDLELPMALRTEGTPDDASLQAVLYGPLVLAADLGGEGLTRERIVNRQGPEVHQTPVKMPVLASSGKPVSAWVKRAGSAALSFEAAGADGRLVLSPLHGQWNRYAAYFKVG